MPTEQKKIQEIIVDILRGWISNTGQYDIFAMFYYFCNYIPSTPENEQNKLICQNKSQENLIPLISWLSECETFLHREVLQLNLI